VFRLNRNKQKTTEKNRKSVKTLISEKKNNFMNFYEKKIIYF
jgi:hypothetical protein